MLSWPDEAIPTANAKLEPEPGPLEALIKIPSNLAAPRIPPPGLPLAFKANAVIFPGVMERPGGGGGGVIAEIREERTRGEVEKEKVLGVGDGD